MTRSGEAWRLIAQQFLDPLKTLLFNTFLRLMPRPQFSLRHSDTIFWLTNIAAVLAWALGWLRPVTACLVALSILALAAPFLSKDKAAPPPAMRS